MSQKARLQVQVLETIGAPLLAAVTESGKAAPDKEAAALTAELLARSVELGAEVGTAIDIKPGDGEGDALRLALMGLAARLIAGHYKTAGRAPAEIEIKKLSAALGAALTFADNFSSGTELGAENRATIGYFQALVPVVNAVAAYSFGRNERKLVKDIAERLAAKASQIAAGRHEMETPLLAALGQIYTACHQAETARITGMDESARNETARAGEGGVPMDSLWENFDRRAAMLAALLPASSGESGATTGGGLKPAAAVNESAPPSAQSAAPPAGNPMSFFKPGGKV